MATADRQREVLGTKKHSGDARPGRNPLISQRERYACLRWRGHFEACARGIHVTKITNFLSAIQTLGKHCATDARNIAL
ncbi:hypothetical protein Y032_0324g2534 [Ancylostoma ceylanicum]|uniref:Uncharacterized protein n=1 Tax=Ancylostoma ceylanicum TaxID=53326 RepID=A0A016S151_9BILA|nr:hypothetical protein Y032_0324g2534 [Ancylostoma ceylanicum]